MRPEPAGLGRRRPSARYPAWPICPRRWLARAVLTSVVGQPPRIVGFLDVDLSATLGQVERVPCPV